MQRLTGAVVLFVAVMASVSLAGKKAVERPLPTQFFSDKTVMVTHVNVANVTGDNIFKTLKAIVPAKYQQKMELDAKKDQFASVDQMIAPLKAVGITRLTMIAVTSDPEKLSSAQAFVLAPIDVKATDDQKQQAMGVLQGMGAMAQMKAEAIPGWIVLHNSEALPEVDELAIEDAAFNDALTVNPDHDIAVVVVPTKQMRAQMKKQMQQSIAEAEDAEEREAIKDIGVLAESEWYYFSVALGDKPTLRMSTKAVSAAKAQSFSNAWASAQGKIKEQIKREMAEQLAEAKIKKAEEDIDYDPKDFEPQPMLDVVDAFSSKPDKQMMVVNMDAAKLQKVVTGIVMMVEALGEAIAEGIAPVP